VSVDRTQLERYLALLESADERIDRESAAALARVQQTLAEHAASIAHRESGDMAESIHPLGPFARGGGMLESLILATPDYTEYELEQGGDHDWANRTLREQAPLLEQLQEQTGRIVAAAIGGER
jgi:hypothetical protein